MKPNTPRLPRFLHGVFLLIEVLIILFTVLLVGLVLFNGRPLFSEREKGNGIHTTINIGEISLSIPKEQYELSIREHPSEGTQIEDLRGYIRTFLFHFDLGWLLAGLMILALGEAFRQGLKLKEESELTI